MSKTEKMSLKEHLSILFRAVKMCFRLERNYTLCLIFGAFIAAITPYIPIYFSAKVIDSLYGGADLGTVIFYVAMTVGLVFILKLLGAFVNSLKSVSSSAMYRNESWMYSEKAMNMAYESIEDRNVTLLRARIQKETQTGFNRFYLHQTIENFINTVTQIIASLSISASFFMMKAIPIYYKLALVGGLVITIVVTMVVTSQINNDREKFTATSVDMNVISEKYENYINHYETGMEIRLYGMENFVADGYYDNDFEYTKRTVKMLYRRAAFFVPNIIIQDILRYGIYAVLIFGALAGSVTVGSIAKYVVCLMGIINTVTWLTSTISVAANNDHYLKRYFSYFDIPNNMYKGSLTVEKRDDNEYNVEFRNVSFKYPNTETYALKNVSLKFKIGEKLAIVGMNGSGKTTFIKLLCRLYDPCEGEILLNGVNIQKYDYDEYMSIFSVVFQDFNLFSFKLGEVVASGKNFDKEKAEECLIKANFGDRLKTLENGLDTYLYKNFDGSGVEISGGEAQKIALARALYKDAPFILLDEPTAALDPISEYEVYSNFNSISSDKTAVYISHRLASCRFCEKIAVFDNGSIVQVGSHDELLSDESGKYAELWHAQAQYYTE